ncbi:hypothetical protein [Agaribacter flavus]|uniref:Uncharacterized protein n=1 Tax=Agaribacter flavus TaxID=1902781 RepID=A0ABV7FMW9_9ALTE
MDKPNYVSYTVDELQDVLTHIDDEQYPDNAYEVLNLLLRKSGKNIDDLLVEYQANAIDESLSALSILLFGVDTANSDVENKIKRICGWAHSSK